MGIYGHRFDSLLEASSDKSKLAKKEADKVVDILKKYLKVMDKNPEYKKKFKELKSNRWIYEDKSLSEIKIYPGKNNASYYTIFADIEWMDQDVFCELCDFLVDVEKSVKNDKEFKKLSTVNHILLISDSPAFEISCKIE